MKRNGFRYGFLIFFFIMFFQMLWNTYLVFAGTQDLPQVVTLLWTFKLPRHRAYHGIILSPRGGAICLWVLLRNAHIRRTGSAHHGTFQAPRPVRYCPMGTMTQLICKVKAGEREM